MKPANHRGKHVRGLEIEIIAGAVQVGGHEADAAEAVLQPVSLGQLDPCDFRDGIPFVGWLQRPGR